MMANIPTLNFNYYEVRIIVFTLLGQPMLSELVIDKARNNVVIVCKIYHTFNK